MNPVRFPFQASAGGQGETVLMPVMPLMLSLGSNRVDIRALVDSGSALNVLPWSIGGQLGASWDKQDTPLRLTGNLGGHEARALLLEDVIGHLTPVRLVFAWTRSDEVPVLLGQVNFFMEFDVSFLRKAGVFEVSLAQ